MSAPMRLSQILESAERTRYREFERVSNILHDETGALLTGVGLKLELLRMDGMQGLEPAIEALEKAFDSVRSLSRNVHPQLVQRVGLSNAYEALVHSSRRRFPGDIRSSIDTGVEGPPELYRIAEEILDNCIRHSKASTVELNLSRSGELVISDNGIGFDLADSRGGLGLLRVRHWGERAHLHVRIRTALESGTMIRVTQQATCHSTSF